MPSPSAPPPDPIRVPYLAVVFPVSFARALDGRFFIDPLWAKDLIEHTRYLLDLTIISYLLNEPPPAGWVAMDDCSELRGVRCVGIPYPSSTLSALMMLPLMIRILWRELGRASVVHTGFSWPIGEAWIVTPLNWLRRRFHLIYVESANWRLVPGLPASLARRWRARFTEALNRYCCNRSDMAIFTQEGYLQSLRTRRRETAHVIEASWIDADVILPDDAVRADAARRAGGSARALRLVYAGRLTAAKGAALLVDAVADLAAAGAAIELDVYGDGADAIALRQAVRQRGLDHRIRLLGSMPYGRDFLQRLRGYDALVVPSLADEQPRIVYDAYSQALPVVASDTLGLRQCVDDGRTGWLFPANDADALKARLLALQDDRTLAAGLAAACVAKARGLTHREMHRRRWRLLSDALAVRSAARRGA